jgi:dipeptidyl aminopeptidase/acylaminoacyl peptidase
MKLRYSSLMISLLLSACVATEAPVLSNSNSVDAPSSIASLSTNPIQVSPAMGEQSQMAISLTQIMADPDWMGRSPEAWYWGDDNHSIFYQQKRLGNNGRDLFRVDLTKQQTSQVPLVQLHQVADRFAVKNADRSKEAYLFENNIYVKTLATGEVKQITRTLAGKSQLMFLTNGQLAYRVGNSFFQHDLSTNQLIELANLQLTDAPKPIAAPSEYLAQQQHKLIQFIATQHSDAKLAEQQQQALREQNLTVSDPRFYLGADQEIVHASLSPNGDKLIVSVAKAETRNSTDIMPNYVTANGQIEAVPARRRVADNKAYQETLYLMDLVTHTQTTLAYDTLPGFDDDVLAKVRAENHAREGKTYQSKKQPRQFYLSWTEHEINWRSDGKQVALMLQAWDNKDRWIATVDFENAKLVPQHRLHDDAWINWRFNEFGWLNKQDALYYTSEQTGYSHLYVKPLNGKAKQLTSGKFEVSNVSLTADGSSFVFKANKKHPGIYEIYQIGLDGEQFSALTDLGGMNDYALSPDASKLLIQHSTVTMPPELYVLSLNSNTPAQQITHTVSEQFLAMPWTAPSVVAIASSHQADPIYSKVYLPKNYTSTGEKYRAVMFSHGAGYLQNSDLGWSGYFREYMFHSLLTQQGYVVIDMDYRASAGYGRDWRTAIYRHMGQPELEDMRDGVNWLVQNAHVDRHRIGTYGGSYGGFLTLMAMFKQPDLFQAGSALRLVSDWAYYNHGYTSNILNTPADDAIAFERSSPIYFADGLQKPLLINAPMVDSNVFFEDSVRLMQRLIELEKQDVEIAIFPVESHGFKQPSSWLHEYRKIYQLFEQRL